MNSNAYIVLTEQGLSAIATNPWPQIAIKYFLPMYDESVDILIHSDAGPTSASSLSAVATSADTQATLRGERIYNVPSTSGVYSLTSKNVATSAATSIFNGDAVIYSSTVNKTNSRTLFNGSALSTVVSGNVEPVYDIGSQNLQFDGGSAVALPGMTWSIDGSHIFRNNLFDSVSFNPNQVNNGAYDVVNGLFKFELKNDVGSYRFNKIAFFIQPMNENGSVNDYYDPILFGQVIFDKSQIVEVGGTGSQTFEVAIQLAFAIRNGTSVVTNNDYWSMVPLSASNRAQNGLFFAGDIALGTSAIPNSWQPRAKVHITDNSKTPHMRLSYSDATSGLDVKVTDIGTSGMVSFVPTSGYAKGFGFAFGEGAYASADPLYNYGKTYVAFAFGTSAVAIRSEAIAIGFQSSAVSNSCVSIGSYNFTDRNDSMSYPGFAFGRSNNAKGNTYSIAMAVGDNNIVRGGHAFGTRNSTSGAYGDVFAIGNNLYVGNFLNNGITDAYAFGAQSSAVHQHAYSIGLQNCVASPYSFALGMINVLSGSNPYNGSIGYNNIINGNSKNWVFGADTIVSSAKNSVSIGNGNDLRVKGDDLRIKGTSLVFGNFNDGTYGGLLVGTSNAGPGYVFGDWSYAYHNSVALGTSARAASYDSISIGTGATAPHTLGVSPLPDESVSTRNIAIGPDSYIANTASYCISIGSEAQSVTVSGYATSVGNESRSTFRSTSLGAWTKAYGIESVAIGYNANTYGLDATNPVLEHGVDNFGIKGLIAVGSNALAWGENYGIAVGYYSVAKSTRDASSNLYPALSVGSESETIVSVGIGASTTYGAKPYPMSTFGANLTNQYAGFMAGVHAKSDVELSGLLGPTADWNFRPCVVFGSGPTAGDPRNGLMVGYISTPTSGVQTAVVLDIDNMPSFTNWTREQIDENVDINALPRGTLIKQFSSSYGLSSLFMWEG
jgi:hypothetical protein